MNICPVSMLDSCWRAGSRGVKSSYNMIQKCKVCCCHQLPLFLNTTCLSLCLSVSRLMGSMSLSNHYRSEVLLDVETAAGGFQQRKGMRRCLPLTFCFHTGLSQYMALQPAEGRRMFESFYPCPVRCLPVFLSLSFQSKCH